MARYLVPLLTKGIGGGAHGHIPFLQKGQGWWSRPYTLLPLLGRETVVTMAQTPCSPSDNGKVVVVVIVIIYTPSSSTIRKDWWSYRYAVLPFLGKGDGSAHGPNTLLHF